MSGSIGDPHSARFDQRTTAICTIPPENHRGAEDTEVAQRSQWKGEFVAQNRRHRMELTWFESSHLAQRLRSASPCGTGRLHQRARNRTPLLPSLCTLPSASSRQAVPAPFGLGLVVLWRDGAEGSVLNQGLVSGLISRSMHPADSIGAHRSAHQPLRRPNLWSSPRGSRRSTLDSHILKSW
jgi:hypothetical protein